MFKAKRFLSIIALFLFVVSMGSCGGGGGGNGGSGGEGNENKLNENTVFVEQDTTMNLVSIEGDVYEYSYTGTMPAIQPGSILLSAEGNGYLRKVVSVQEQGGNLIVETEQASLTDAFEELHLETTITMDSDIIYQTETQELKVSSIGTGGSIGVEIADINITASGDYDISVDGDFDFTPVVDIIIDISWSELTRFKAEIGGTIDLNMDATYTATHALNITPPEIPLTPSPIPFFTATILVPVGLIVVPVVLTGEFTLDFGTTFSANSQAITNFGFTSTSTFGAGFEYNNNTWDPISTFDYTFGPYMDVDNAVSLSVKPYVRPKVGIYIYSTVGPYVDLRPYGKGSVIMDSDPNLEAGIGITGNAGGELEILSHVIGTVNFELFDFYAPVWTYPLPIDDTTPPSVPTGFSATAVSSSQIDLSWNASTDDIGVTGYKIYRDGVYLKPVTTTSTSDTGLSSNTPYCYTVSAYDIAGNESGQSSQSCATTLPTGGDTTPPTVPTGLTATAVSSSQINLSWNASTDDTGVTGYNVYRDGAFLKQVTGTSTSDTGLSSSTQYCYTVSAYDAAGNESGQSGQGCATTPSGGGTFNLPDTGQTQSYTDTWGEDSDYTINPPSYTDNGNGTVTDNVTGFMWQQEDDNQTYNWYEASGTYDATYNPGSTDVCGSLTLGGYADWRLPAKKEIMSIVNYGTYNPAIDETYFPNTSSNYWSSTTNTNSSSYAWTVQSNLGGADYYFKSDNYFVRCVRDGRYPAPDFTDNGDGTVTDNVTTLMWQKEEDNTTRIWEESLNYCEGLSLAGYGDWRLPNIRELESITDDTKYNPAIDTTYFPNANSSDFWSSTTNASYSSYAWYVNFLNGNFYNSNESFSYYVRCVR